MAKYFGTDGIRGKYGEKLDEALAYKTGLARASAAKNSNAGL